MRIRGAAAIAAIAMFVVAGCGGSDSTSTTASLSKAEFVKRGNDICDRANTRLETIARKEFGSASPTATQVESFLGDHVIPALQQEAADIRELPVPQGDEQQVDEMLTALEQGAEQAKSDPNSLQAHGAADPLSKAIQLARAYGLKVCAAQ